MDIILKNFYFKFIFSIFCILILINGSNFIDGLNGLLIGYFLIVIYFMYNMGILEHLNLDGKDYQFLFFGIIIILALLKILLFALNSRPRPLKDYQILPKS